MPLALIIEDDSTQALLLKHALKQNSCCDSIILANGNALKALLATGTLPPVDLALVDLFLPDMDGIAVTILLKEALPDLPIVVMTHYGNRKRAGLAIHAGARDFLHKPIPPERLKVTIGNILETEALRKAIASRKWKPDMPQFERPLKGTDSAFTRAVAALSEEDSSIRPILITGEAGTGKTLLAEHIARERGAQRLLHQTWHPGMEMRNYLGESGPILSIFNYHEAVLTHSLMEDFIFSLNECPFGIGCVTSLETLAKGAVPPTMLHVTLPPLRERIGDLEELSYHFLQRMPREHESFWLDTLLLDTMRQYDWPGNITELEQFLHGAAPYAEKGKISLREWEHHIERRAFRAAPSLENALASQGFFVSVTSADGEIRPFKHIEEEVIRLAMEKYHHSPSVVARRLGLGRTTIYRKVQRMGPNQTN